MKSTSRSISRNCTPTQAHEYRHGGGSMGLYTRVEYEQDLDVISKQRVKVSKLLIAKDIGPLGFENYSQMLDEQERVCKQRLVSTGLILRDRERMQKHQAFAWVLWPWKNREHTLIRHNSPTYKETTLKDVLSLASGGCMIFCSRCVMCKNTAANNGEGWCECHTFYMKSPGMRKKSANAVDAVDADTETFEYVAPVWVPVTKEQAMIILAMHGRVMSPKTLEEANAGTGWATLDVGMLEHGEAVDAEAAGAR